MSSGNMNQSKGRMVRMASKKAVYHKWVSPTALTQNGAASLISSGSPLVDLFFGLVRGTSEERVQTLTEQAWITPFTHSVPGLDHLSDELKAKVMTLRCLFRTRDIRNGGAGERDVFINSMAWIAENDRKYFIESLDMRHFEHFGCWRDLTILYQKVSDRNKRRIVRHCVKQLWEDLSSLEEGNSVSQCAKWMPSEGQARDKDGLYSALATDFALINALKKVPFKNSNGRTIRPSNADFRKMVISPLRSHINIVEHLMSENQWEDIDFSHLPSKASLKYISAFGRHCPVAYSKWKSDVKAAAEAKIQALKAGKKYSKKLGANVTSLYPHEIISPFMFNSFIYDSGEELLDCKNIETFLKRKHDIHPINCIHISHIGCPYCKIGHIDESDLKTYIENHSYTTNIALWEAYVASALEKRLEMEKKTRRKMPDILVMADTSCSMDRGGGNVKPINVAVALAMLFSELNSGPFANKWINFSTNPTFQEVKIFNDGTKTSIRERVQAIDRENWSQSTNIQAAFDLILDTIEEELSWFEFEERKQKAKEICPEMLVIVSDMQFNPTFIGTQSITNFDAMRAKFAGYGLEMPLVVFWNVSSSGNDVPVTFNEYGVALMSGFNPKSLDMILSCNREQMSPLNFIIATLSSEAFLRITHEEEELPIPSLDHLD